MQSRAVREGSVGLMLLAGLGGIRWDFLVVKRIDSGESKLQHYCSISSSTRDSTWGSSEVSRDSGR